MSGCYRGAKTNKYPLAIYVHCKAHVLNLALVHSSNQSNVTDMFETVQQIAVYIGASAKRLEIFQEIDQDNPADGMPNCHILRRLSDTQ